MPYCSNCGAKLPETAAFCSECGAKVVRAARVDASSPSPGRESASQPEGFAFDADTPRRRDAAPHGFDGFDTPQTGKQAGFSFDADPSRPKDAGDGFGGFHVPDAGKPAGFSFDADSSRPKDNGASVEEGFDSFASPSPKSYRSFLDEREDFSFTPPSRPAPSFDEDDLDAFVSPYVDYDATVEPGASRKAPARRTSAGTAPRTSSGGKKGRALSQQRSPKKKRRTGLIALLCVLALAVVGFGAYLWIQNSATPEELYDQAVQLMAKGEYKAASEKFLKVLKKEPENVAAILNLADCYVNMTEKEKAVELLQAGYAKTQDERIKKALAELGMEPAAPAGSSAPPETTTTAPPETTPPPAEPAAIDLSDILFGDFASYESQLGQPKDKESVTQTYPDAEGNETEIVVTTYTYDGLSVTTQDGKIVTMAANFDKDVPFNVLGIGKGATYNDTLSALGTPETAATEEEYDTLVYLPENGKAVKFYFRNDTLAHASLFLGYSQQ
ncbi:tetratricopeptide repeat protein [Zongyangia hominis]|uniref:Tetratricopeptide repeat protein n=1 Tax=Zongyangia hominis TaxID=2763677 RepID=A0A926EFR0_9FIRM|nr:tetratricopeptide repeat protein [Zongyangia hominis]MBC8571016.1 tetratricopeptide repeat protein [Zongyangia hominis]